MKYRSRRAVTQRLTSGAAAELAAHADAATTRGKSMRENRMREDTRDVRAEAEHLVTKPRCAMLGTRNLENCLASNRSKAWRVTANGPRFTGANRAR